MEMNSSPKSYPELISASNNKLMARCQSSSGRGVGVQTRSASWGSSLPLPIGEAGSGGVHDGGMAAAPDPKRQQESDVIPLQNNWMQQREALVSRAHSLVARISEVLGPAGPCRVITGNSVRRCLAFMKTEISFIEEFLMTLKSSNLQHFDGNWWTLVVGLCTRFLKRANNVFREIDPSRHTSQLRAAQCFFRHTYHMTKNLYIIIETPYRYPHLILTSSDLGLTPQLSEAGALPLVGIDRPAKKILRWLTHQGKMDRSQLRVMCIVGPVGIGKTTLAVELCNRLRHETVGGWYYFQCNVMVRASRGIDRNILLLQDILSQVSEPAATALSSDPSQTKTMEVLVRLVSECLQDKRYFIIIDDVCQESDWEEIKGAFPNTNNGSRILITTRVTSIAEACCSGSYYGLVHEMKPLSGLDSERLLAKAVGSADGCLPNNLKQLCDEILRRCDGIPLFLTAMADWLKDGDEEHLRFPIHCEGQVPRLPERLEQALSSAFNDLPYGDLRSLSLYMSMFRYGYKFDKDRLISKWIQEGHLFWSLHPLVMDLSSTAFSEATSKAEAFFSQLVDRNVITCVASKCKHMEDEAEACQWQINHFMQQFLESKCAKMRFIFTTATLKSLNESSSRIPQRLALHHPDPRLPSLHETMDLSQTRSLAVSGVVSGIPLEKFVNLVVLDFEGWENLRDKDLLQVCKSEMLFLTYLNIRNTRVSKLPNEIKELQILETLDISYTQITELPLEVFKLRYLVHLDARGTRISQLPKEIVGWDRFEFLPGETTPKVLHDVGHLHNLETLATVDLTQHPATFLRALGDLRKTSVLAVTWSFHQSTDRDYCEALLACIEKWKELESLTIHCGLGCSMEFLGSLEKPCAPQKLKKFKVTAGRFACVPPWIDGLKRLAFVQITVCNKQTMTGDLQILGALPKLQCLIIGLDFIPGQAIVIGNEGFRELLRFSIDCPMPCLTFQTGAMPKLRYLQLKFCSTPASQICVPSGISNLCRLTEVALCYNVHYINSPSVKMTVEAVTQQVAEHRNPIDLFINGFELDDVQEADDEVTEITIGTSSRTNAEAEDDAQADGEEATAAIQCEITDAES